MGTFTVGCCDVFGAWELHSSVCGTLRPPLEFATPHELGALLVKMLDNIQQVGEDVLLRNGDASVEGSKETKT